MPSGDKLWAQFDTVVWVAALPVGLSSKSRSHFDVLLVLRRPVISRYGAVSPIEGETRLVLLDISGTL